MPNDITRLLATVSALGISLGVGFEPALGTPEAVKATPAPQESHIKKATLHVRKAGAEQESVHRKGESDVPSQASGRATKVESLTIKQKATEAPK